MVVLGISVVVFIVFDNKIIHVLFKKASGKAPCSKLRENVEQFMHFIKNYLKICYFGKPKIRRIEVKQSDTAF